MIGLRGRTSCPKNISLSGGYGQGPRECSTAYYVLVAFVQLSSVTNNNQLGKVLGIPADEVIGLHEILIDMSTDFGFKTH
jgi:hypothetical protein